MKIAVINDIHVGKALVHNEKMRAASHLIENRIEEILCLIVKQHAPDVVVNLGDLIRSESKNEDQKSYSQQLSRLKKIPSPFIHLIGNHELKKMSPHEIESMWFTHGFDQKTYGKKSVHDFELIWLGLENSSEQKPVLPDLQLDWLREQLQKANREVLIFSHYTIDDQNPTGNFFYEAMDNRSKEGLFLKNQAEVRNIIQSCCHVKAVFQGHLHYFHVKTIQNIPYFTCPAMGDNICAPNASDNIPEIYTIIECDKKGVVVKAYSREYCFAGYEQIFPI